MARYLCDGPGSCTRRALLALSTSRRVGNLKTTILQGQHAATLQCVLQVCGIDAIVVGDLAGELRKGGDCFLGELTEAHRVQHVDKRCAGRRTCFRRRWPPVPIDSPWSFCRNTLWSTIGFPTHASQDSASNANVDVNLSLSGTGGSWQKSPDRTSCHHPLESRLSQPDRSDLTCMPPKGRSLFRSLRPRNSCSLLREDAEEVASLGATYEFVEEVTIDHRY